MVDQIEKLGLDLAADQTAAKKSKGKAKPAAPAEPVAPEVPEEPEAPEEAQSRIEIVAEEATFKAETLAGDLAVVIMDIFQTRQKPWSAMLEDDQKTLIKFVRNASREIVTKMADQMSAAAPGSFYAKLEKYSESGGIKINLTAEPTRDNVLACHDAYEQMVTIKRVDPKKYMGAADTITTQPDQAAIKFEGETAEEARKRTHGFTDQEPNPDHPADDSDLAGIGIEDEGGAGQAPAGDPFEAPATFAVFDPDAKQWLDQEAEVWLDDESERGQWIFSAATKHARECEDAPGAAQVIDTATAEG